MSSEPAVSVDTLPKDQSLVTIADPRLTLAARKLAGSACCLNCGTALKGPFCSYCGQPDKNFMRFFPALLRDLLDDLLDLDSRFVRTLKPLIFKPGRLTRDFMGGRRFRYTPPMRLYIFSSIAFFLLAALLSSNAITKTTKIGDSDKGGLVQITTQTADQKQQVEEALDNLPADLKEQIDVEQIISHIDDEQDPAADDTGQKDKKWFEAGDISYNDEPWNRETNPVDIKWFPGWLNDRINDEIEGSPKKTQAINKNPNLILDQIFDILPATMFVLLPVVALIFKFWYLFAKRYYVEHLIFSLHNHSFIFVSLVMLLLTIETGDLLTSYGHSKSATGSLWLVAAISVWIPLYLLISLRVVYQQNWLLTLGKFFVIGFSYTTLLVVVTTGVAIASFVLL